MPTPRPESRLDEIESKMAIQDARIRELSSDTAEEFKALRQDNKQLFEHMQQGFNQAHAFVQERFEEIRKDITEIKTTMATKDELVAMENRIRQDVTSLKEGLLQALRDIKQQ